MFKDALLHTVVVMISYLSYRWLPICSKQFGNVSLISAFQQDIFVPTAPEWIFFLLICCKVMKSE